MSEEHPLTERLRRMAAEYEAAASRGRAEQIAARAVARGRAGAPSRHRSPVAILAGVALLFALAAGLGALADSAVPGQFLYTVDRAFETVGLGTNGAEERLEEAIALADRGDTRRAVLAVNEALEEITRKTPVTVTVPPITLPETTTTTAPPQPDTTAAPEESVSAAESTVSEPDPVQALKLAAEYLLRTVREEAAEEDVEQAASDLAAAAASLEVTTTTTTTTVPTTEETSTTTTTEATTTTTTEHGNGNGTTTTTLGDGSSTTTVPADGESTTTTTVPPIILPPAP